MATYKGFIKDQQNNILLPITRGELILDAYGQLAFHSESFIAQAPDLTNNNPGHAGLMTAGEKAILARLSGLESGQNLVNVYEKLNSINTGFRVGNSTLNFYNTDTGAATPITIQAAETAPILISEAENVISFGLNPVEVALDQVKARIQDIVVDGYGRVTNVIHATIADSELPDTLNDKTLNNAVVGSIASTTTSEGQTVYSDNAVVPKSYIDSEIAKVNNVATGALIFQGNITETSQLSNLLVSDNINKYYKVVPDAVNNNNLNYIIINSTQDYDGQARTAHLGDTLIIAERNGSPKFVYIPSGNDDAVTSFSIHHSTTTTDTQKVIDNAVGPVVLKFDSDALSFTPLSDTEAKITLPQADASNNGYLSSEDWIKFTAYSDNLAVEYNQSIEQGEGTYKIGDIKIGSAAAIDIYGLNSVSTLGFDTNSTTVPTLKFTETGANDVTIGFVGGSGISTTIDSANDNIVIAQNSTVKSDSTSYLEVSDDDTTGAKEFGIKIGGYKKLTEDSDQLTYVNGLADTDYVLQAIESYTSSFEIISYSLITEKPSDPTDPYRYGNDKLKAAVTIDI